MIIPISKRASHHMKCSLLLYPEPSNIKWIKNHLKWRHNKLLLTCFQNLNAQVYPAMSSLLINLGTVNLWQ